VLGELLTPEYTAIDRMAEYALLIVSEVRLLREGIAGAIDGKPGLSVVGLCETLDQALSAVRERPSPVVLLDASFPNGPEALRHIRAANPAAKAVVFAISETEENVIAWAKAGAAGYIPTTTGLDEVVRFIECIIRGEQICSAVIASRLIRWVGSYPQVAQEQRLHLETGLTLRENEIMRMIAEGLSNKEIARRLKIELSTTKSHVHNLLAKLGLQRRGQVAHWALAQDARR